MIPEAAVEAATVVDQAVELAEIIRGNLSHESSPLSTAEAIIFAGYRKVGTPAPSRGKDTDPEVAARGHLADPVWHGLHATHKCRTCGGWVDQGHGGEWKHGGPA